jgi:hypothetical protein
MKRPVKEGGVLEEGVLTSVRAVGERDKVSVTWARIRSKDLTWQWTFSFGSLGLE